MQRVISRAPKPFHKISYRFYATKASQWRPLPHLPDPSLPTFIDHAFKPSEPFLFPRSTFTSLPAIEKWFHPSALNQEYLAQHGNAMLTLEYTRKSPNEETQFQRGNAPLSLFLAYTSLAQKDRSAAQSSQIYVAQSPLATLPDALRADLPTPEYVTKAGKGDVYDSSLWMGIPPTYTPLHKDPNHNVFVQLSGKKSIRLMEPEKGKNLLNGVRRRLSMETTGKRAGEEGFSEAIRGEEMMVGRERGVLEEAVWGEGDGERVEGGYEAELESGDGLFIPLGWWHSVKGIGEGVTGSVNWWFR